MLVQGGSFCTLNLSSGTALQQDFVIRKAVLGMSPRNVTSLGSNLASVTDLRRIQTPHNLCCDFGDDKNFKTRWSGGDARWDENI